MLKRDLYYESIPTKSLRDDVRYLGNILGRVIKKQEGEKFFNLVEKIRLLSKANTRNKNNKNNVDFFNAYICYQLLNRNYKPFLKDLITFLVRHLHTHIHLLMQSSLLFYYIYQIDSQHCFLDILYMIRN